ncbi:MAG TPA: amino acid adenylation domain-containing protein [Herpetosiphonaceae bacterium]
MNDLVKRLAALPPEKQELLAQAIQQRAASLNVFPLSSAQQRLWFLDQWSPGDPVYHLPGCLRLHGSLDEAALERSIQAIIQRHEVLRTTFVALAGQPFQIVHPALPVTLALVDLRHLPPTEQEAQVKELSRAEARRPFDLAQGPLLRTTLLRLSQREHILLLTLHHIVADGWSLGVFWRELGAGYTAFVGGDPLALPALSIQYADFAHWEQQRLTGERRSTLLAYWQQQLAGLPPLLDLPTDHPRPSVQTTNGTRAAFLFSRALTDALIALSQREGVTLFMTLLAAFQVLMARYSEQADIAVGTAVAGRTRTETEALIGCFVNTLVLRTDLAGNPTFQTLLARVHAVCASAYAHQELPFEQLVEALQPDRTPGHTPLVQVFFALHNGPLPTLILPDLTLIPGESSSGTAKFDLAVDMTLTGEGLRGEIEYNTDLFEAATIARLREHFQVLLAAIVANPLLRILELPLLTAAEQQQMRHWNATAATYPADQSIHALFEIQALRTPDTLAVVHEAERLTYAELNQRANQVARYLRALGVGPDTPVGVCVERSAELIVVLLGVLKAGGAYVPLDPTYPPDRLALMVSAARMPIVVTQRHLRDSLPQSVAQLVELDSDRQQVAQQPVDNLPPNVQPDHLAYVIYTSGSTGQPKGVACAHRGVVNLIADFRERQELPVGAACSCWTSISFDVSVYEIWQPLLTGGTLHLVPESVRADGAAYLEWLSAQRIQSAYLPPFLVSDLHAWLEHAPQRLALRRLLVGVEPIPEALLASICERVSGLQILNGYGPTETVVCTTLYEISPAAAYERHTPIGRPMRNSRIYLLNEQLQPVPVNVPGEIYIGGVQVARGYLNRPDLTAERFLPDPFSRPEGTRPGARLYKTGDRARYLPDGNLMFLGRSDRQVKIRGFRIELEEIERTLSQHPDVRESVVLAREDAQGDTRLVAYIVESQSKAQRAASSTTSDSCSLLQVPGGCQAGAPHLCSPQELRQFLGACLPAYMIPSAFLVLEALPLMPNGKVDRSALLAMMPTQQHAEDSAAPGTPFQERVAQEWRELLGLQQIGLHDNFFELGGHSLLVTRLLARLRAAFDVDLPLRSVFEAPTVAALAERIMIAQQARLQRTLPPIVPAPRDQPLPLSFAQQRLWLHEQMEPGDISYNIPLALRLSGTLDVPALEHSLNTLVARHEALRTTFTTHRGEPVQVIAPSLVVPLPLIDLSSEPHAQREESARRLLVAGARQPFDLERGPLLRATLLRVAPQEHVLLLNMHHIVSDGWSTGVLIHELTTAYTAYAAGRPAQLTDLSVQYGDYAVWQRRWLPEAALEAQRAYWKTQLGGHLPQLELPLDHPRPARRAFLGAQQPLIISQDVTVALTELSQREQATLFMTLLAAFNALLYRYTGQEDIIIGSPIAHRTQAEIEPLIGFFVNMLALRTNLAGNPSFRELLARVREVCLEAYVHQDLPFEQVVEEVLPRRHSSPTSLFTVAFVLQNAPLPPLALPNLVLQPLDVDSGTTKYDLTLNLMDTSDGLRGMLEYDTELFDATTIEGIVEHYQILLQGIVSDPDQRLTDLPLISESEQRLLEEWGNM